MSPSPFRLALVTTLLSRGVWILLATVLGPYTGLYVMSFLVPLVSPPTLVSYVVHTVPVSGCILFVAGAKLYCFKSTPTAPPRLSWMVLAACDSAPMTLVAAFSALSLAIPLAFRVYSVFSFPQLPLQLAASFLAQFTRNALMSPSTLPTFNAARLWYARSVSNGPSFVTVALYKVIHVAGLAFVSVTVPVVCLDLALIACSQSPYYPGLTPFAKTVAGLMLTCLVSDTIQNDVLTAVCKSIRLNCLNGEILDAVNSPTSSPFTKHCAMQTLIDVVASVPTRREPIYQTQPSLQTWTDLRKTLVGHLDGFATHVATFDSPLLHTTPITQAPEQAAATHPPGTAKFVWPSNMTRVDPKSDTVVVTTLSPSDSLAVHSRDQRPLFPTSVDSLLCSVTQFAWTKVNKRLVQQSVSAARDHLLLLVRLGALTSDFQLPAWSATALVWFLVHAFTQDPFGLVFPDLVHVVPALVRVVGVIEKIEMRSWNWFHQPVRTRIDQWDKVSQGGWDNDRAERLFPLNPTDVHVNPRCSFKPAPYQDPHLTVAFRLAYVYDACTAALIAICARYPQYMAQSVVPKLAPAEQMIFHRLMHPTPNVY